MKSQNKPAVSTRLFALLVALFFSAPTLPAGPDNGIEATSRRVAGQTADKLATKETKAIYAWLHDLAGNVLFGVSEAGDAVFKDFGVYPALIGYEYYDYGPVERKLAQREAARDSMIEHCHRGGLLSLHDHIYNFGGVKIREYSAGDNYGLRDRSVLPLKELLPGGSLEDEYKQYLHRMAEFMKQVQVDGKYCPILFRPFHEMNGRWFWWGGNENAESLIRIWRHTFDVLVNREGVHHLIWVWSPSISTHSQMSVSPIGKFWPGQEFVDLVGLDGYADKPGGSFGSSTFQESYVQAVELADSAGLPFAWTEIGFADSGKSIRGFWTDDVLAQLRNRYAKAKYFMVWHGRWLPRASSPSGESAKRMIEDGYILTQGRLRLNELVHEKP